MNETVLKPVEAMLETGAVAQPPIAPEAVAGEQVRPWVRYAARTLDLWLFALVFGFVLGVFAPSVLAYGDVVLGLPVMFVYLFVEPMLLATWGTTPGKALLRVRLREANGEKLVYIEALNRCFAVWFRGLGMGLPIVSLITQIVAYRNLVQNGETTWDADGELVVSHEPVGAVRTMIAILLSGGYLLFVGLTAQGL